MLSRKVCYSGIHHLHASDSNSHLQESASSSTIPDSELFSERPDAKVIFSHLPAVNISFKSEMFPNSISENQDSATPSQDEDLEPLYNLQDAVNTMKEYKIFVEEEKLEEWTEMTRRRALAKYGIGMQLRELEAAYHRFYRKQIAERETSNGKAIAELVRRYQPDWRINIIKQCQSYKVAIKSSTDISLTMWKEIEQLLRFEIPIVILNDIRTLLRYEILKLKQWKDSQLGRETSTDTLSSGSGSDWLIGPDIHIPKHPSFWDSIITPELRVTPATNAVDVVKSCLRLFHAEYIRVFKERLVGSERFSAKRIVSIGCRSHGELKFTEYDVLFEHMFWYHRKGSRVDVSARLSFTVRQKRF